MHDSDGERLARTYEPVLLFSRDGRGIDESFFPMDAAHFVAGSRLYREGAGLVAPAGRLTLDRLASVPAGESADHFLAFGLDDAFEFHAQPDAWAPRREAVRPAAGRRGGAASAGVAAASSAGGADESSKFAASRRLPHAVRDSVLVRYGAYRDLRRHPPPYYYRVMHDGGYLVIQYWMFYAYNDWGLAHNGLNDHEGDWEAVFVYSARRRAPHTSPTRPTSAVRPRTSGRLTPSRSASTAIPSCSWPVAPTRRTPPAANGTS